LFEESTIDVLLANRFEEDISVQDSGCLITYSTLSDYDEEVVDLCKKLFGPAILIIGDSRGLVFYDIIQKLSPPKFIINWSRPASRPISGIEGQYEDVLSYLEMYPSTVSKILFVQSGTYLLEDGLGG
jgi:hypothetical protein